MVFSRQQAHEWLGGGASTLDPARVGCSLQRWASAQRAGTRRSRPSRRICTLPEVRIPTSMDAGCARAREIRAGRTAPRVLALGRRRRFRRELHGPLNRMTQNAEVLKSGVAPAGRHFCGAQPSEWRSYRITSSARASIESEILIPSVLAVFMLMINRRQSAAQPGDRQAWHRSDLVGVGCGATLHGDEVRSIADQTTAPTKSLVS